MVLKYGGQLMKICGLQKLTLLDFPDRVACTIFTLGCNFTCPFCQNSSLVLADRYAPTIDEKEVLNFLESRIGLLDGVCISGGEPTLQRDLKDFIKKVREMGYSVKLDTNGYNPDVLEELLNENLLDFVSMDIKNSLEKYAVTAGMKHIDVEKIKKSICLLSSSRVPYELRTTIVKEFHDENDMKAIAELVKESPVYFLQAFRDSPTNIAQGLHPCSDEEMQKFKTILLNEGVNVKIRGE